MKEIITKRFEKARDSFIKRGIDIFKDFTFLVFTRFTYDILKELEEQENKPFDPELLGFIESKESVCFNNKEIKEYYINTKDNIYTIRLYVKEKKIFISYRYFFETKPSKLCDFIKIPNHRFGVELLKNLGVIE